MVAASTRTCGAVLASALVGPSAAAAPITFGAPPPVEHGQLGVAGQAALVRAPDGPAPENADETVLAGSVVAMAGVLPRTTLAATVQYIDKSTRISVPSGGMAERETGGIGDVTGVVLVEAFRQRLGGGAVSAVGFAGVKAPLGKDDASDPLGRLPQRLQVGTGAWDVLGGAMASWRGEPVAVDAALSYAWRGEANDFDAGDELRGELSVRRCVVPWQCAGDRPLCVIAAAETRATWQAADAGPLAPAETGGVNWYVAPGLQAVVARDHTFEAAVEFPLTQPEDQHVAAVVRVGYRLVID